MNFLLVAAAFAHLAWSKLPKPASLSGSVPEAGVGALNAGLAANNSSQPFNASAAPNVALPASLSPFLYLTANALFETMVSSSEVMKLNVSPNLYHAL